MTANMVELHNTNRSLGLLAAYAGWPRGVPSGKAAAKAEVGAAGQSIPAMLSAAEVACGSHPVRSANVVSMIFRERPNRAPP